TPGEIAGRKQAEAVEKDRYNVDDLVTLDTISRRDDVVTPRVDPRLQCIKGNDVEHWLDTEYLRCSLVHLDGDTDELTILGGVLCRHVGAARTEAQHPALAIGFRQHGGDFGHCFHRLLSIGYRT